ncbi:response regulator transcription factor [Chitinophaga sp. MM2321]|uniref:response regulator transcription factor n=1 Tax=Chitinophaga sp. MM2321 TaxID=3137178 RepID=UPI0032D584E4
MNNNLHKNPQLSTNINKNPRILLVEDDMVYGNIVKKNLEEVGYRVEHCFDGQQGWEKFQQTRYDLCLVDIVLPKMNGFELAHEIRKKTTLTPIFFFSSERTMDGDRMGGFDLGADGYLVKPFSLPELQYRILSFLKWTRPIKTELLIGHSFGQFIFHYRKLKVYDKDITGAIGKISPTEAKVLRYFFSRPNIIIKRDELLLKVWGKDDFYSSRTMDVFLGKVRKQLKIEPRIELETIHNVGIRLNVPEDLKVEKITIPLNNSML